MSIEALRAALKAGLVDKLREQTAGYDEWRVQDPATGAYCIAFSWMEVVNPEREARAWLADHVSRFPNSMHAGYEVKCVRVVPEEAQLRVQAADALAAAPRLLAERDALLKAAQSALEALEALQGGCTDSDDGTVEALTVWCPEVLEELTAAIAATQESDK